MWNDKMINGMNNVEEKEKWKEEEMKVEKNQIKETKQIRFSMLSFYEGHSTNTVKYYMRT